MTLYFPDVSAFQTGIDLAGAKAVCIKATEGSGWTSPDYGRAKSNAAGHGAYVMAYHFLHAGGVMAQAQLAHSVVGGTPLMIDCEPTGPSHPNLADVMSFVNAFRNLNGVTHLVYFPHWYWQSLGSPSLKPLSDKGLALWSSAYTVYSDSDNGAGWRGYGGLAPAIWQYTDRLHFNGHDIDFNAFRGTHPGDQSGAAVADTLDQLKSLATTGKISVHKPVPTPPVPPARRFADGKRSLRSAVNREGTTVLRSVWLMAHDPEKQKQDHFGHIQADYLRRGDYDAIMPAGMTYWVG